MSAPASILAGIALIAVLALPQARAALEAGMTTHMLVQIPLLAVAGVVLAGGFGRRVELFQERLDQSGIATALIVVFATSFWMLPRALDGALADGWMETAKFLSLPLLVGMPARACAPRLSAIAAGFILANLLSMWAVVGWLYYAFPARLCNYYGIEQQVAAGGALVWMSGLIAGLWLASFFFGGYGAPVPVAESTAAEAQMDGNAMSAENVAVMQVAPALLPTAGEFHCRRGARASCGGSE